MRCWSGARTDPNGSSRCWGCLLQGIVPVPIDYRASPDFLRRVAVIVKARVLLAGSEVTLDDVRDAAPMVWPLADLDWNDTSAIPDAGVTRDDVAEIIFTSGATAEPKGVVITHRNLLANIVPVEREILKYRKYARPFSPIRFLNLLPLSHMFGQSMATFVPPMLAGKVVFIHGYNPNEIVRQIRQRRISVSCRCRRSSTCCASTSCVRRRRPRFPRNRRSTSRDGGGATAASIARSASSSGASWSARHRSIRRSRSSGAGLGSLSCRGTASPRRRRS